MVRLRTLDPPIGVRLPASQFFLLKLSIRKLRFQKKTLDVIYRHQAFSFSTFFNTR